MYKTLTFIINTIFS